jgi:hypothetical protein
METVHKKFNISFTNKTDFHFYPRDVLAAVRACAIREGAICSKNSKIHIMGAISSTKMLLCYGLHHPDYGFCFVST